MQNMVKMTQTQDENLSNEISENMKEIELEKDKQIRGSRIVLRTIARDMGSQYMEDENGNRITFEDWQYNNKFINYK